MGKLTSRHSRKGRSCLPRRCKRNGDSKQCKKKRKTTTTPLFSEQVFLDVMTTDDFVALPAQDTANKSVYSYSVVNKGSEPVVAQVEIGPNGEDYLVDVEEIVPDGGMAVVVPVKFQRYTRLLVKSLIEGRPTEVKVYFQSQRVT